MSIPKNSYYLRNTSSKFDRNKSNAVQCISHMRKYKDRFDSNHIYQVLFACSNTCQNVYDILNDVTPYNKKDVASNLTFLNSELLSEKLLAQLMISKSEKESPLTGDIYKQPWILRTIESEQTSILSHLFLHRKNYVRDSIEESGKHSSSILG